MAAFSVKTVVKNGCTNAIEAFLEYETPKIVHIRSKKVGIINRTIQILIIGYIALYVIWWEKGYQETDTAVSATITKLKGVALTNFTALNITVPGGYNGTRVWDVPDYVVPPQENDAFFVMTNAVITPSQTQGHCPEDPSISSCVNDTDCPAGQPVLGGNGNGIMTGHCVKSEITASRKSCEVYAWCPVEDDRLLIKDRPLLEDSQKFTVLIKNYIEFPKFNCRRTNILDTQNSEYLKRCQYNGDSDVDRLCPIFVIGDIVKEAQKGIPNATYNSIALKGGVIVISIDWDCNLDVSLSRCLPKYSFSRLDESDAKIAKGSNFRYSSMYERDGVMYRDLFKAYGIRFIIKVTGKAGKFAIVPLLLNVGSGIGLLALASVVCDIFMLYVLKKRHIYKAKKFLNVHDEEPESGRNDEDDDDGDDERQTQQPTSAHRRRPAANADDDPLIIAPMLTH